LKVVIVGAGEVGFHIASHLTVENKDVVVIDKSVDAIQRVSDNLDVQVVQGSGSSPVVLDKAGIRNAEVILAVTDSDETNIVACLVANMLSPSTKKMARVRDGDFDQYHGHFRENAPYIDTIINPEVEQENLGKIQSFILGPLSVSGEIIGTLNVGNYTPEVFSERDEAFMAQLLSLLGSIIENRQLFEAIEEALATTEEQARRLSLLNVLSERLGRANTFEEVLSITLEDIDKIIPANQSFITVFDITRNCFQVHTSKGSANIFPSGSEIPVDNSLTGLVMREGSLHTSGNILEESYIDTDALSDGGVRSIMVAPLSAGGEVIGTLNIGKNESHAYSSRDENLIFSISSLVSSTIDNRQLLGQIQRRSVRHTLRL